MIIYITKYALTRGIIQVNTENIKDLCIHEDGAYMFYRDQNDFPYSYRNGEWYKDESSAITKAEEMKNRKIQSLKKQIAKLEKMNFT